MFKCTHVFYMCAVRENSRVCVCVCVCVCVRVREECGVCMYVCLCQCECLCVCACVCVLYVCAYAHAWLIDFKWAGSQTLGRPTISSSENTAVLGPFENPCFKHKWIPFQNLFVLFFVSLSFHVNMCSCFFFIVQLWVCVSVCVCVCVCVGRLWLKSILIRGCFPVQSVNCDVKGQDPSTFVYVCLCARPSYIIMYADNLL